MPTETSPEHSNAFGPAEDADATRQAQHSVSNDSPTDVNFNAIVARSQALSVDLAGKAHMSNQDRRDKIADDRYGRTPAT